ncbi:MAG: hypothetical protein KY445_07660 [Armatimonadetes bacterium]|nr:hypothetical protein [Armatimonadota bacterium]
MSASTEFSPLPLLFGKTRRALGWQGFSTEIPENWNPGKFSGTRARGDLRVDDENGVRLELRWENSKKTPDVEKSVANFLQTLEKQAKKRGEAFAIVEDAKVVSRGKKRKDQVTSFGWTGAPGAPTSCGFGAAWFCPTCDRVTFAHVVGHQKDKAAKIERLAGEILGPLECHGEGGWDSWSFYDIQIEIPAEFELARAQMLLNKIEVEWIRPRPVGLYGWGRRPERLKLSRFPVANVLLTDSSLEEWADWNVRDKQKLLRFGDAAPTSVNGHEAVLYRGGPKDPRSIASVWLFDKILRRRTPPGELRVWNCQASNRLWAFENEVAPINLHVASDVLDSLDCH